MTIEESLQHSQGLRVVAEEMNGARLSRLPWEDLPPTELAEIYAYYLILYGDDHSLTNMIREQIRKRDLTEGSYDCKYCRYREA